MGERVSRRIRKIRAWKEYRRKQKDKTLAIMDVGVNASLEITKALTEHDYLKAEFIGRMAKEQQKQISWQYIPRPNKYGYFPKPVGITVSVNCDTSKFDESIRKTLGKLVV